MGFYRQFDLFDPKVDNPPYHPFSLLPNIVSRARSLLRNRSHDEILTAAQVADWMIDDYFRQAEDAFIEEQLKTDGWACRYLEEEAYNAEGLRHLIRRGLPGESPDDEYFDFPTEENTNVVDALKDCIDSYDIEDDDFKDAKQYEYFAVLSLWLVGDCLGWLRRGNSTKGALTQVAESQGRIVPTGPDSASLSLAGQYAILAMDAVCHGERLRAEEHHDKKMADLRQKVRQTEQRIENIAEAKAAQKRSNAAREAAAKRHEEHDLYRQDVIRHFEENEANYKSIEAAARAITKLVPMTHRTIVEWIRAYKKQRPAGKP